MMLSSLLAKGGIFDRPRPSDIRATGGALGGTHKFLFF